MNSGYRDPEKLKAAQELANSFKHGGGGGGGGTGARSSGTYGGVKKHQKKPNASTKSLHSTPAMSANGVPNVSMRNYPSAGNFVPRESNHSKTKGPALMGNALDFLKHQDAANPPRPSAMPTAAKPSAPQAQASTERPEEHLQKLGKRNFEQEIGEERKDRIRKRLENLRASDLAPIPAPPIQGKTSVANAGVSSSDANILSNFYNFVPPKLAARPPSEADTALLDKQSPIASLLAVPKITDVEEKSSRQRNRLRFNEFVPGGTNHHAALYDPPAQPSASTRLAGLTPFQLAAPAGRPATPGDSSFGAYQQASTPTFPQNISIGQAAVPQGNHLINPFANMGFASNPQPFSPSVGAPILGMPNAQSTLSMQPNYHVQPTRPTPPAARPAAKPKQGLSSSRWAR